MGYVPKDKGLLEDGEAMVECTVAEKLEEAKLMLQQEFQEDIRQHSPEDIDPAFLESYAKSIRAYQDVLEDWVDRFELTWEDDDGPEIAT